MTQEINKNSGITTGRVMRYTLLPEFYPRLKSLFGSGFGHVALYIAYLFGTMRLLPATHPYLRVANIGRYGVRHVIAEAHSHLQYNKKNIDKVLIFYTIIVGLSILMLQLGLLVAAAVSQMAHAAEAESVRSVYASYFVTPQPEKDIAFNFLDLVFGFEGVFGYGENITEVAAVGGESWPTPFHRGMHALFSFYNMGIIAIAFIIFMYYVLIVVGETAQSGTPFGKRFNKAWAPIRMIVAVAMLMPLAGVSVNGVQYLTLHVAKWGSSLATNSWLLFLEDSGTLAGTTTPIGDSRSLIAMPSPPPATDVAEFFMLARTCQLSYRYLYNDSRVQAYLVYDDQAWDFDTLAYEEALDNVERNDMVIRIGRKHEEFARYAGNVEPTCGEMSFTTMSLGGAPEEEDAGGEADEAEAPTSVQGGVLAAYLIRECYFYMMQDLWNSDLTAQVSANLVLKYTPTAHKQPNISFNTGLEGTGILSEAEYVQEASNYFIHKLTRDDDPVIETYESGIADQVDSTAGSTGDWSSGVGDDLSQSTGSFLDDIAGWLGGIIDDILSIFGLGGGGGEGAGGGSPGGGSPGGGGAGGSLSGSGEAQAQAGIENCRNVFNEAREAQHNDGWKYELAHLGWGGAGIWYNRIAEVNGEIISASYNMPIVKSYPLIMQHVERLKKAEAQSFDLKDRFNPISGSGRIVSLPNERDRIMAVIMHNAYAIWPTDTALGGASSSGNFFTDAILGIFGLRGLFDMYRNQDNHPLAQLSMVGKSLIESAIMNFGIAIGSGIFGFLQDKNTASKTIASNITGIAKSIGLIGISIGFILFYIIPLLPFAFFFMAVGGWVKAIFEAMVGVPLWGLAHIRIDGEGIPGPVGMNGYYLLFEIFIRPTLIVFGLLAAVSIFSVQVYILNEVWDLVAANVGGTSDLNAAAEGASASDVFDKAKMRGLADTFFLTILYTLIVYMLGMGSFKLIDQIPNSIMRWMGASLQTFGELAGNPAANLVSTMYSGTQKISSSLAGIGDRGFLATQ